METVEHRSVQLPGNNDPGDAREAEAREDVRLLAAVAREDQDALARLYRRRGGLLYALLVRLLGNEMEAQEVMQDTFVHIWRHARQFDAARSSPQAWMIMIARGRALDRLRARSRRAAHNAAYENEVAAMESNEATGAHHVERGELASACGDALKKLPESQGRALHLAFFRGWTHEEIAAELGAPLGTVKARIRRGLLALRQALREHHG